MTKAVLNPKINREIFIAEKAKGKNNTEAAMSAGSKNEKAAKQAGWRISKSIEIKQRIESHLKKQGIDIESLLQVYVEALQAEKTDAKTGGVYIDYSTRMRASDRLFNILGIETKGEVVKPMSQNIPEQVSEELKTAMKSGDEVELVKAVFRKS